MAAKSIPMVDHPVTITEEGLKKLAEAAKAPKPTPVPTPPVAVAAKPPPSAPALPPVAPKPANTPVPTTILLPPKPVPAPVPTAKPVVTIRQLTPRVKTSIYLNLDGNSLRFTLTNRFDSIALPSHQLEFSPSSTSACRSCIRLDGKISDIRDDSLSDWQLTARDANCEVGFDRQALVITRRAKPTDCLVGSLTELRKSPRSPAAVTKKKAKIFFTRSST